MKSKLAGLAVALSLLSLPALADTAPGTVYNNISGPELQKLMQNWGYRAELGTDSYDDPIIKSSARGVDYNVSFYNCDERKPERCESLTLVIAFQYDKPFSMTTINAWNKDSRFSRAYLDAEDDPVLEMDIQVKGGITAEAMKNNFENWDTQLKGFLKAINWQ